MLRPDQLRRMRWPSLKGQPPSVIARCAMNVRAAVRNNEVKSDVLAHDVDDQDISGNVAQYLM